MASSFRAFGQPFRTSTTRRFVVLGVYLPGAPPVILRRTDSLQTAFEVRDSLDRGLSHIGVFEVESGRQLNYQDYLKLTEANTAAPTL